MRNIGNISGIVLDTNPPQWSETWVCHLCKEKMEIRVYGSYVVDWNDALKDYKEKDKETL